MAFLSLSAFEYLSEAWLPPGTNPGMMLASTATGEVGGLRPVSTLGCLRSACCPHLFEVPQGEEQYLTRRCILDFLSVNPNVKTPDIKSLHH